MSIAHHVDHMMRDVTGWPFRHEFNPFSASLFVSPVIAAGIVLSCRNWVGARLWAVLAAAAALFILAVHVRPAAGDSETTIPDQYGSTVADVVALAVLGLFLVSLLAHFLHEVRRLRSEPASR